MLFVPEPVRAPELPEDFDVERPISFSRLIKVVSDHANLPPDFTDQEDLNRVAPENIERGLYFGTREAYDRRLKHLYRGIGFSATQFLSIARSPSDLANHTYTRAERANDKRDPEVRLDRDTLKATANRAAGHVLEEHVMKLEVVRGELSEQRLALLALHRAIKAPGRAHWNVGNLNNLRKTGSDIIHGHIEIAAVNMPWNNKTADDLQNALHYNLYGHAGHNNRRLGYWARYVLMAGKHTRRQLDAAAEALFRSSEELRKYQPYLNAASDKHEL